jgi:hypothetical protein
MIKVETLACVVSLSVAVAAAGCGGSNAGGPGPNDPQGGAPTGPLASLDTSAPQAETWSLEGGGPAPFLFYAAENVRLSAACKPPSGPLNCAAATYLRRGAPAQVPRRQLDGRMSAGTRACMSLGNALVNGSNTVGAQDTFCRFPDGSLVSTGALEQYKLHVIQ